MSDDLEDRMRVDIGYNPPRHQTLGDISDAVAKMALEKVNAAQHTALRRWLALSLLFNVILLVVLLVIIGGW